MNLNPVSELVILSSMITLFLAIYTWIKKSASTSIVLFYLLVAITIWSLFYGLELASTEIIPIRIFLTIQYIGISTIPVLWLIFSSKYTKNDNWLTPLRMKLLFLVPLITVAMVATNSIHFLFYSISELNYTNGYWYHKMKPGLFYWVHIFYSYTAVLIGLLLFFKMYFSVERKSRKNILFFIIGALIPYIVSVTYIFGLKPYGFLDTTPLGFIVMGIVLTVGIFSVNLFVVNPLALDLLFDNIPDAIFVVDNNDSIVSANPSARRLLRLKNKTSQKRISRISKTDSAYSMIVSNQVIGEVELNGSVYHKTVDPIADTRGERLGMLIVLRDITERKRAEEALKESERQLRETNSTKDKLFSIIAHDLRNPFNSIMGFSSLLVDEVKKKDYSNIEEYSGIILDSAERAMNLLNNLMEWSSAQTGRIGFNPEKIDLGSMLNEVIGLLRDTAAKKDILIFNSLPANTTVKADKHMLSSILRNLISNSIKFTNKGGTVMVQADKNAKEILISVSDNGVGVTNKMLSELFRSEVLVSTKGTDNENGSGLGLELCKEFVEKHGGKIWAESEPDKGSTFYFTIPLNMQ